MQEYRAYNELLKKRDEMLKKEAGHIMNGEIPVENLGGLFEKDKKGNNSPQSEFDPQLKARRIVFEWANAGLGVEIYNVDEVYVVWFAKTLQNWKALLGTTATDGRYYEVTYNGDKGEAYVDTYKKTHNIVVVDED